MTNAWLDHLRAREAVLDGERVVGFGARERLAREPELATTATVLGPLADRGVLRVTGPDAPRFLQSQLTNDVTQTSPERSQLGTYCSPKGRMLACFRLFHLADGFLLAAPASVVGILTERLTYYRLRAEVTLENASSEIVHLGVAGPATGEALGRASLELPAEMGGVRGLGETRVVRVPDERPRVEILVPLDGAKELWDTLAASAEPVGPEAFRLLDVRAGIPWIFAETSEAFVPQMANLHALSAVSFTKGCFPGQEIVARLRYRGVLKRRMYRLRTASAPATTGEAPEPEALRPGDDVLAAGKTAGKVVMAAAAPGGGHELLAVLLIDVAEADSAALTLASGAALALEPLPYDVERAFERTP